MKVATSTHRSFASPTFSSDVAILITIALARFIFHLLTNGPYGFHRDELAVLDDAGHLDWGYVAYPPFTPFVGRVALELFGLSTTGVRLFGAIAQCVVMVLAGLIARRMGGGRHAQVLAAVATAIAPMSLIMTSLFQYITFDMLWWVVVAYCVVRLAASDDPRWWVPAGTAIGLGMMTKYTMAYLVAGVVVGVLLTPLRRHLRSGWLWLGVVVSILVFLPNLVWQIRHDFISLEFLQSIHARDVAIGRTEGFLAQQLYVSAAAVTLPLWLLGLWFCFFDSEGRRFRVLGWIYVTTLILMLLSQARFYYLAPAVPMLLAAGSVLFERRVFSLRHARKRAAFSIAWILLAIGGVSSALLMLPLAPVATPIWNIANGVHDNFREQLGWEELTREVARIYHSLPPEERPLTGIFAGNYGEAGAINLYGPAYDLPRAISGINSYWARGWGNDHQTLIILGGEIEEATPLFDTCEVAGRNTNRYGVENEESRDHPDILLCRGPRFEWPEVWPDLRSFG